MSRSLPLTALDRLLMEAKGIHLLCIGDIMLDQTVDCIPTRVSPEAPVLVAAEQGMRTMCGGAANVAANVAAIGAAVDLAGIVGEDPEGDMVRLRMVEAGIRPDLVFAARGLQTTRKTRIVADGQQLLRLDRDGRIEPGSQAAEQLAQGLRGLDWMPGAIVLSDYAKGVLDPQVLKAAHALARRYRAPLLVDPKGDDWARYGPVDLVKPNLSELAAFTRQPCRSHEDIAAALEAALVRTSAKAVLVTRGGEGATLLGRDRELVHLPALEVEVADVCGAGDTNIAALAIGLALGRSLADAGRFAQMASASVVRHHGTAVVSPDELRQQALAEQAGSAAKLVDAEALERLVSEWRGQGLRIGFTNGCFDLLHPGHVHTLESARRHCDRLVVGLNSDASVRRLKGEARPLQDEAARASVIAALTAVDAVVLFGEDTPLRLIERVMPDVLVKGGDYELTEIVGAEVVTSSGGKVMTVPLRAGHSTSRLVAMAGKGA